MFIKTIRRNLFWIFIIVLILFRYQLTKPHFINGQKIRITGKVSSEPIRYKDSQYVNLSGLKIYLPLYPEIGYGDVIVVEGRVNREKMILAKPELVKIQRTGGFLYEVRKKLIDFYRKFLPEPHSSLVAGVVIGSKSSIPENFWNALKKTSTAHVVVASGMNVTLVAGFLFAVLVLIMPRRKAIPLALTGVWFYTVLSGFDAPLIRAAIMGSIAFTAQELGRLNYAWRTLFLSAAVMLLIRPDWVSDLGFILSFVATASLMLFEKKIESFKLIKKIPSPLREDFSTSLAAQIGVAPIIFFAFGQFNILSPIINGLVLWTIAPITIMGMAAGILSFISIYLGKLALYLIFPLTSWFIGVINFFSRVSF